MIPSSAPLLAGCVVALAGRRPDAPNAAPARFPLASVERVRAELGVLLHPGVHALVCSAACGADLLALEAAGEASIPRHVVLPFDRDTFRASSVVDRPGEWGPAYDRIVAEVAARERLESGAGEPGDPAVYLHANERIVRRALEAAAEGRRQCVAVVVWDGAPRGEGDVTEDFRRRAEGCGLPIRIVLTV